MKHYVGVTMKWTLIPLCLTIGGIYSDTTTTVTIYPQWLSQGGNVRYESNRWNKHNGLEKEPLIPRCRSIRTDSGRWINRDLNGRLFQDVRPVSSIYHYGKHKKGLYYMNYFHLKNATLQQKLFSGYLANINTGFENDMFMMLTGHVFPTWMNQSEHKGQFPNNIDAVAEFMVLLVQGIYDYTKGRIPPYFEPINEPDSHWKIMNFTTVSILHKLVAQKLHARFNINVVGPTLTGYSGVMDKHGFSFWTQMTQFMDANLDYLDAFSFHSYNSLIVSGKSHRFAGMNEARLVAFVDLVENNAFLKKGKIIPLVISEYGRDGVVGMDKYASSGIVDFATIYHSNAHRFTQLGLREYIDRSVAFLLANEQFPGHDSLNWSLFTLQGKATHIVDVYKFWYNFTSDYSFIRTTSEYDGEERTVSPLAMGSSLYNETVILLHSYSQKSQKVKLVFQNGWIKPTTGEATCITIKDNWNPVMTFNEPFDIGKTQGMVELPPESTCRFTLKTSSNQLPSVTINETTYYGSDTVIPIRGDAVSVVISLPNGQYESARLRVSTSWPINVTNSVSYITINLHPLHSFYKLYDSDKLDSTTNWQVWEFVVPTSMFVTGDNQVQIHFSNNMTTGYVSSVALVTGQSSS